MSISSSFDVSRYADLLGETKELSLRNQMPRSKIVFLFTFALFGMFAIEFFMKVSSHKYECSYDKMAFNIRT